MTTIVTRAGLGSPLPSATVDANFTNLNTDKLELGGTFSSGTANSILYLNGSKVLTTGSALTFDGTTFATTGRTSSVNGAWVASGAVMGWGAAGTFTNYIVGDTASNYLLFQVNAAEGMRLTSTGLIVQQGAVFNESGADSDFRVESDTRTHMFFVDASANAIGINISNPIGPLFEIRSDRTNGTSANALTLSDGVTGTQTAGYGNQIVWYSNNSATYAALAFEVGSDGTNNQSQISLYTQATAGGSSRKLVVGATGELIATPIAGIGAVFNEDGVDADFRVESDTNTHMLFVDAGNDVVSIGTSTVPNWYSSDTLQSNTWAITSLLGADQSGWSTGCYQDAYGYTSNWKFKGNYPATLYAQSGDHAFFVTTSARGTGNAITWREALRLSDGAAVFNEESYDIDFRVESDTNTHALFVDAGNSRVGINWSVPSMALTIGATSATGAITNISQFSGIQINGNQADVSKTGIGYQDGGGGGAAVMFGRGGSYGTDISFFTNSPSNASAGGMVERGYMGDNGYLYWYSGAVFNEYGDDADFRVESDSVTHMLFVNAGTNRVSVASDLGTHTFNVYSSTTGSPAGAMFINAALNGSGEGLFIDASTRTTDDNAVNIFRITNRAGADVVNVNVAGEVTINEGSSDVDFRVESDTSTHMLFVDAGNNSVNINTNSPLGGTLNVNGTIYGNENHKVHYPLPYFYFGAGGIADEYWVLARRYVGTAILASGLMGRIVGSRGSTFSGNVAGYQNIIVQSAYLSNEGPLIDSQGPNPNFEAIDIISISGVEYYAARGRTSGGPCDNGMWFEGMMINNTGDNNVFSYTRASSAGVSVVTTNVATLNTWAVRDTYLQAQRAGYDRQTISNTETNFNDAGLDYDFRVESDTNTHALFVDAGNNAVGVSTSTPANGVAGYEGLVGVGTYGKVISAANAAVAASGYMDITLSSGGGSFAGFLTVNNVYAANANERTQVTYSIFGRGTNSFSAQLIATDNGSTGGMALSISNPSDGVIRITNDAAVTTYMTAAFFGCTGF